MCVLAVQMLWGKLLSLLILDAQTNKTGVCTCSFERIDYNIHNVYCDLNMYTSKTNIFGNLMFAAQLLVLRDSTGPSWRNISSK